MPLGIKTNQLILGHIYKPASKCNIFNFQESSSIKLGKTRHQLLETKQITPIRSEKAINVNWEIFTFQYIKL